MEGVTFVGIPFYSLVKYQGMGNAVPSLRRVVILERLVSSQVKVRDVGDLAAVFGMVLGVVL